jgi:hypothetical protein
VILDEAEALLDPVSDIDGFMLACLVDASTGMVLASRKDQDDISLPTAAAGAADIANSGRGDGPIYFRDGKVAYAESSRTPGPATQAYPASGLPPLSRITAILAIAEPTVDAALELLSAPSRYAKFRPSRIPAVGLTSDISLEDLLAEVNRRQRVLSHLSAVLTADTALARNPHIRPGINPRVDLALGIADPRQAR